MESGVNLRKSEPALGKGRDLGFHACSWSPLVFEKTQLPPGWKAGGGGEGIPSVPCAWKQRWSLVTGSLRYVSPSLL